MPACSAGRAFFYVPGAAISSHKHAVPLCYAEPQILVLINDRFLQYPQMSVIVHRIGIFPDRCLSYLVDGIHRIYLQKNLPVDVDLHRAF